MGGMVGDSSHYITVLQDVSISRLMWPARECMWLKFCYSVKFKWTHSCRAHDGASAACSTHASLVSGSHDSPQNIHSGDDHISERDDEGTCGSTVLISGIGRIGPAE